MTYDPTYILSIGKYDLSRYDENNIAITHESGEGGSFDESKLEAVIEEFYNNNF